MCRKKIDYEKNVIESFPYNTSVYYAMYKDHLYLVNGEGNDCETALHSTLVYIVTIYDVITKTARMLCQTYSCQYCIVYICGEWVIYAEPVTYFLKNWIFQLILTLITDVTC